MADSNEKTIEKALIGSIQKFSVEDGPGIRTSIFFKGCPLDCRWCHNPEMISPEQELIRSPNNCIGCGFCISVCPEQALSMDKEKGIVIDREKCTVCLTCADSCYAKALRPVAKEMTVDDIIEEALLDKEFYDSTGGGITLSGGEVLMHASFIYDLVEAAGKHGINVCLDTCGYGSTDALMDLACRDNVTNILYDIKGMDDEIHRQYTGVSNRKILEHLEMLASDNRTAEKLIIRMPLIAGVNDGEDPVRSAGDFFRRNKIKHVTLLPYHNLGISKKRNIGGSQEEFQPPSEERLQEIEAYFRDELELDVHILGRL